VGTIFDREHEPPDEELEDRAYQLVRAGAGLLPGAGELLDLVITPPLEKRKAAWMNDVAAALRRLEDAHRVSYEQLRDNPAFLDAVLTATQAALRTSQQIKREALRNAVLNTALGSNLDVASQQIFLGMVDRFTELHLKILKLFHDPRAWRNTSTGAPLAGPPQHGHGRDAADVLENAFPELQSRQPLYEQVWLELHSVGLVRLNTLHNSGEGEAVMNKRTTPMGDAFVAFITSPVPD